MRISTKTTRIYTVEFIEKDKKDICGEIQELANSLKIPALRALQTILENPENR